MIQFWIKKNNRSWLQSAAVFILNCFLFSTISAPFAQANFWEERRKSIEEFKKSQEPVQVASVAGASSIQTVVGNGMLVPPVLPETLMPNPQSQTSSAWLEEALKRVGNRSYIRKGMSGIPAELLEKIERYGEVERVHLVPGDSLKIVNGLIQTKHPLIIQIQDAHGVVGVQKNITYLLRDLINLGVGVVGVEGSEGVLQGIEKWRNIPDRDSLIGVAGYLLKEGLLTGVELAGLSREKNEVEFYGVEDGKKYVEQVQSFKNALKVSRGVANWHELSGKKMAALKGASYAVPLKKLDENKSRYEKGELKLGEWVSALSAGISGNKVESRYPNIGKYLKAYELEKAIDFKKVELEQKNLLKDLSVKLNRQQMMELLEESLLYRLGKIGYADFYGKLEGRCRKVGVKVTPEMSLYMGYVARVEGIDRAGLFQELKGFEEEAWSSKIGKDEKAKEIYELDKDYKLIGKAIDFKLSVDEWKEYIGRDIEIKKFGKVMDAPSEAAQVLEDVRKFNELSLERSRIFANKLRQRMGRTVSLGVLVAGGFHSAGVEEKLKEKNISTLTIRPRMDLKEIKEAYHPLNSFKRDLMPLEKMFFPEKVTLNFPPALGDIEGGIGLETKSAVNNTFRTAVPAVSAVEENNSSGLDHAHWKGEVLVGEVGNTEVLASRDGALVKAQSKDGAVILETDSLGLNQKRPITVALSKTGRFSLRLKFATAFIGAWLAVQLPGLTEGVKQISEDASLTWQHKLGLFLAGIGLFSFVILVLRESIVEGQSNDSSRARVAESYIKEGVKHYKNKHPEDARIALLKAERKIKEIAIDNSSTQYSRSRWYDKLAATYQKIGWRSNAAEVANSRSEGYQRAHHYTGEYERARTEKGKFISLSILVIILTAGFSALLLAGALPALAITPGSIPTDPSNWSDIIQGLLGSVLVGGVLSQQKSILKVALEEAQRNKKFPDPATLSPLEKEIYRENPKLLDGLTFQDGTTLQVLRDLEDFPNDPAIRETWDRHYGMFIMENKEIGYISHTGVHRLSLAESDVEEVNGKYSAMGGARMAKEEEYSTRIERIQKALELGKEMSFKDAAASLKLGGSKQLIIVNKGIDPSPDHPSPQRDAVNASFAKNTEYYASFMDIKVLVGQDGNESDKDLTHMFQYAPTSIIPDIGYKIGKGRTPAPATGVGVWAAIQAALERAFPKEPSLKGKIAVVTGFGGAGQQVVYRLLKAGAKVVAIDRSEKALAEQLSNFEKVLKGYVEKGEITQADAVEFKERITTSYGNTVVDGLIRAQIRHIDIFAPCALKHSINETVIKFLKELGVKVISGSENDVLEDRNNDPKLMRELGIVFVPDYIANPGGAISANGHHKNNDISDEGIFNRVHKKVNEVFDGADRTGLTVQEYADRTSREIFEAFSDQTLLPKDPRTKQVIESMKEKVGTVLDEIESKMKVASKFMRSILARPSNGAELTLASVKDKAAQAWIESMAQLLGADLENLEVINDTDDDRLLEEAVASREMIKLPDGTYYMRSHPKDVARSVERTFVATSDPKDRGANNNWRPTEEILPKVQEKMKGALNGKKMYVIPYLMGPIGSPVSQVGIQITDNRSVALNMLRMTKVGNVALEELARTGKFIKGVQIAGDLDKIKRTGKEDDDRFFVSVPDRGEIWSYGSAYGGNALLGKKFHSLRQAGYDARNEGWLAEHMLILEVIFKKTGQKKYVVAAFPSASGKTNLAMMVPPDALKEEIDLHILGDDIAWLFVGEDGSLRAINPENGYFGVVPGTNLKTNPMAMGAIGPNTKTIFTNVAYNEKTGELWWEGKSSKPENLEGWKDWEGKAIQDRTPEEMSKPWAHPNSRFTAFAKNAPNISSEWQNPKGVPISAIFFGGRVSEGEPLIRQLPGYKSGIFDAAMMGVEATAAAEGKAGKFEEDPFAMKPFFSYNEGEYYRHWMSVMGHVKENKRPAFFHVNWFRKDKDGKFLWPGFGENLRPVLWALDRVENKGSYARTPIGFLPTRDALNLNGLDISNENLDQLLSYDRGYWMDEVKRRNSYIGKLETLGVVLPEDLKKINYGFEDAVENWTMQGENMVFTAASVADQAATRENPKRLNGTIIEEKDGSKTVITVLQKQRDYPRDPDIMSHWDRHYAVFQIENEKLGYTAYIAVHRLTKIESNASDLDGQWRATGGTRINKYEDKQAALLDALELSREMGFKNAAAGLKIGGSKGVIYVNSINPSPDASNPDKEQRKKIISSYANAIHRIGQSLGGGILTGEDVNISEDDTDLMHEHAPTSIVPHVASSLSLTPSHPTAVGVKGAIEASISHVYPEDSSLKGKVVAVQGLGKVGSQLAIELLKENAIVIASETDQNKINEFYRELKRLRMRDGYQDRFFVLGPKYAEDIYNPFIIAGLKTKVRNQMRVVMDRKIAIGDVGVHVFSPCSYAQLEDENIGKLSEAGVKIVAGSANNAVKNIDRHPDLMNSLGILYVRDYIANAGGVLAVNGHLGQDISDLAISAKIYTRVKQLLERSEIENSIPQRVADEESRNFLESLEMAPIPSYYTGGSSIQILSWIIGLISLGTLGWVVGDHSAASHLSSLGLDWKDLGLSAVLGSLYVSAQQKWTVFKSLSVEVNDRLSINIALDTKEKLYALYHGFVWTAITIKKDKKESVLWKPLSEHGKKIGEFYNPEAMTLDSNNQLWVADGDTGNRVVQMLDPKTGEWKLKANFKDISGHIRGLAADKETVWALIADQENKSVVRGINIQTGKITSLPPMPILWAWPVGQEIAADLNGNIVITARGGQYLFIHTTQKWEELKLKSGGEYVKVKAYPIDGSFIFVRENGQIVHYNPFTKRERLLQLEPINEKSKKHVQLHDIAFDKQGKIYAVHEGLNGIQVYDPLENLTQDLSDWKNQQTPVEIGWRNSVKGFLIKRGIITDLKSHTPRLSAISVFMDGEFVGKLGEIEQAAPLKELEKVFKTFGWFIGLGLSTLLALGASFASSHSIANAAVERLQKPAPSLALVRSSLKSKREVKTEDGKFTVTLEGGRLIVRNKKESRSITISQTTVKDPKSLSILKTEGVYFVDVRNGKEFQRFQIAQNGELLPSVVAESADRKLEAFVVVQSLDNESYVIVQGINGKEDINWVPLDQSRGKVSKLEFRANTNEVKVTYTEDRSAVAVVMPVVSALTPVATKSVAVSQKPEAMISQPAASSSDQSVQPLVVREAPQFFSRPYGAIITDSGKKIKIEGDPLKSEFIKESNRIVVLGVDKAQNNHVLNSYFTILDGSSRKQIEQFNTEGLAYFLSWDQYVDYARTPDGKFALLLMSSKEGTKLHKVNLEKAEIVKTIVVMDDNGETFINAASISVRREGQKDIVTISQDGENARRIRYELKGDTLVRTIEANNGNRKDPEKNKKFGWNLLGLLGLAFGSLSIRSSGKLQIRKDISEKYGDLFGDQNVNGKKLNVAEVLAQFAGDFASEFKKVNMARSNKRAEVEQKSAQGKRQRELYDWLPSDKVIEDPDGNSKTVASIRQGMIDHFKGKDTKDSWQLNPSVPLHTELLRSGLEGTGPAYDLGMGIGAINAGKVGAVSWMWDGEDAGPIEETVYQPYDQHANIKRLLSGEFNAAQVGPNEWRGRAYQRPGKEDKFINIPKEKWPTIFYRVPGLHLTNDNITYNGQPIPAMIGQLVMYALNNFDAQSLRNNSGIYFYIPKIESVEEALLVGKLLKALEEKIGIPRGTIKIKMLNERGEYVLAQEAIMWVLRENLVGPNVGRWDYQSSRSYMFQDDPAMDFPDMYSFSMLEKSMTAGYTRRNAFLAAMAGRSMNNLDHISGYPIGGMAAQLENKVEKGDSPEVAAQKMENSRKAVNSIRVDKLRERLTGLYLYKDKLIDLYRQSWVATVTPGYVAAGFEPLSVELNKSGTVEDRLAPLQALVDQLTVDEKATFQKLKLVDGQGNIIPFFIKEKDLTVGEIWSDHQWHLTFDPPAGDRTERGLKWEIQMASEFMYQMLGGRNAAAVEDPFVGNGLAGILKGIFSGWRLMCDHATNEGNVRALINAVRHGQLLTQDGATTKAGQRVTPELFMRLWRQRREDVDQFFEMLESKGVKVDRERAALDMEVLKDLVVKRDKEGNLVPQTRNFKYVSRVLFSLVGKSKENQQAILDAIFETSSREEVVDKVNSGEWNDIVLKKYDYVYDNFTNSLFSSLTDMVSGTAGSVNEVLRKAGSIFVTLPDELYEKAMDLMGKRDVFKGKLNEVEEQWNHQRSEGRFIKRLHTADQVAQLRLQTRPSYPVQNAMAWKLYGTARRHQANGTSSPTIGAFDESSVDAMARGVTAEDIVDGVTANGLEWNYVGGWAESYRDATSDQARYQYGYVSDWVARASKHLQGKARRHALNGEYDMENKLMLPLFVDIDTGHMAPKQLVEYMMTHSVGDHPPLIAALHIEDQAHGSKKCGHMAGKVLISTEEHIKRLNNVRFQLDLMGLDTLVVARTDAEAAEFITSDKDERDHPFIIGVTNPNMQAYHKVIQDARASGLVEAEVSKIHKKWKEDAGLMTLGSAVAKAMEKGISEDGVFSMTVHEWKEFAKTASFQQSKTKAKELGINVYSASEWKLLETFKGTLGEAIKKALERVEMANHKLSMTSEEWVEFAAQSSFEEVVKKAWELEDSLYNTPEWDLVDSLGYLDKNQIYLFWDHEIPSTEENNYKLYMIESGLDMAIARNKAFMPYADISWMEQHHPDFDQAATWAKALIDYSKSKEYKKILGVSEDTKVPAPILALNTSPSFYWRKAIHGHVMTDEELKTFLPRLGKVGIQLPFITYGGAEINHYGMQKFLFGSGGLRKNGMLAWANFQDEAIKSGNPFVLGSQEFANVKVVEAADAAANGGKPVASATGERDTMNQFREAAANIKDGNSSKGGARRDVVWDVRFDPLKPEDEKFLRNNIREMEFREGKNGPSINGYTNLDYNLVWFTPNDKIGQFFDHKKIRGAYHFRDLDGKYYIFLQKGLEDIDLALEHEKLEIIWSWVLSSNPPEDWEGRSRMEAAHILAWGQQIGKKGWTSIEESPFLKAQIDALLQNKDVEQLKLIAHADRSSHKNLRYNFLRGVLSPEQLSKVVEFENSFKEYAAAKLKELENPPQKQMVEAGSLGGALKLPGIPDLQEKKLNVKEVGLLRDLGRAAPKVMDPYYKIEGRGTIPIAIIYYTDENSDPIGQLLSRIKFAGAYSLPNGLGDLGFVFIKAGLPADEEKSAIEHEVLELFWYKEIQDHPMVHRLVQTWGSERAAHIMAFGDQVVLNGYKTIEDFPLLKKLLDQLSVKKLQEITKETENSRVVHRSIRQLYAENYMDYVDAIPRILTFENSVRAYAQKLLDGNKPPVAVELVQPESLNRESLEKFLGISFAGVPDYESWIVNLLKDVSLETASPEYLIHLLQGLRADITQVLGHLEESGLSAYEQNVGGGRSQQAEELIAAIDNKIKRLQGGTLETSPVETVGADRNFFTNSLTGIFGTVILNDSQSSSSIVNWASWGPLVLVASVFGLGALALWGLRAIRKNRESKVKTSDDLRRKVMDLRWNFDSQSKQLQTELSRLAKDQPNRVVEPFQSDSVKENLDKLESELRFLMQIHATTYALTGDAKATQKELDQLLRKLFGGEYKINIIPIESNYLSVKFEVTPLNTTQSDIETIGALAKLARVYATTKDGSTLIPEKLANLLESSFDEAYSLAIWAKKMAAQKEISLFSALINNDPQVIDVTSLFSSGDAKRKVKQMLKKKIQQPNFSLETIALVAHGYSRPEIIERLREDLGRDYNYLRLRINNQSIPILGDKNRKELPSKLQLAWLVDELKTWGQNFSVITDNVDRWQMDARYQDRVKFYELIEATLVKEVISLDKVMEEIKSIRVLHIQA